MMRTLRLWLDHHDAHAPEPVAEVAAPALPAGAAVLMEVEAKALFGAAGLPVGEERRATDAEGAVREAEAIGYPVVLKLDSPDVAHKTEVGGVQLRLADAEAVRAGFGRIMDGVRAHAPAARVAGVQIERAHV